MKNFLLALLCISFSFSAAAQCSVVEIPLSQRASAATLIVEGKVINQNSFWNSTNNMIYTSSEVEIYKIFKGSVTTSSIQIISEGGIVGLTKITAEPVLGLHPGDIGVFTCAPVTHMRNLPANTSLIPRFEAYASVQGFVKYDLDAENASDVFHTYANIETELYPEILEPSRLTYSVVQAFNIHGNSAQRTGPNPTPQAPSITNFSPTTITAGTGTVLTINGSGFGATQGSGTVGFKNADDGGATFINPLPSQYISWSNTQITVEVPSSAGTGTIRVTQSGSGNSAQTLTISYAHLNVEFDPGAGTVAYGTDHVDDNGTGGYTWRMNTAFDAATVERASFMRAFDSWRCATGVNWTIGATTSINDAVSDGTNIICNDNTAPLSPGILGVCYSYWSGCASGPTIIWYVNELDIIFDEGSNISPLTWEYGPATPTGSEYDFETVAVHELGHGHQLGHVINNGAIMHYAISNGTFNRTPGVNDLAGANFVQAKSLIANVCGPGAMTAFSCGSAPVAAFSGTPTEVCAGNSVSFTDESTNTPTSWSWVFQGGTPSSSTAQNPSITYSTPGTYSVSLTATNPSGSDVESVVGYITVNANPTAGGSVTNLTCNGSGDGAINLNPASGQGPYSFVWSPSGQTTEDRTGLSAGSYTVVVTDANGCTVQNSFSLTQPTVLSVIMSNSDETCSLNDGTATATPSGGTAPYSYSWSPSGQTTQIATGLSANTYTCTVTDNVGCTVMDNTTVTLSCNPTPVANFSGTPTAVCAGGTVDFTDLSSNSPTSWSWTFQGGSPSSSSAQNPSIVYNTPGTYSVSLTATNSNGSDVFSIAGYITVNEAPTAIGSVTDVLCHGGNDGAIDLTPSNGTAPYVYFWSPTSQTTQDLAGISSGSYTVTVLDAHNCSTQASFSVVEPSAINMIMSKQDATCANNDGTATATVSGGTPGYAYLWTPGNQTTLTATGLSAATYTCAVVDGHGCLANNSITVNQGSCGPTQLAPASCGATLSSLSQTINCVAVPGATNYQYKFMQGATQIALYTRGNNLTNCVPSNIPQLGYAQVYTVYVRAQVGSVWGVYGVGCNITTPAFPLTQLTAPNCGITMTNISTPLNCVAITGTTNYQWRFMQGATQIALYTRGNYLTDCNLTNIPAIQYGQTYDVTVRSFVGGVWSAYGAVCTVTTPAFPTTQVAAPNCGATLASLSTQFNCVAVSGATNYQWKVQNGPYVSIMNRGNYLTNWSLSFHAGTTVNTTYTVTVRAMVGGIWGAFGTPCTVTSGPVALAPHENPVPIPSEVRVVNPEEMAAPALSLSMDVYPNPFAENITVVTDASVKTLFIYNAFGELVRTMEIENGTAELKLEDLSKGIYLIQANSPTLGSATRRVIKQ